MRKIAPCLWFSNQAEEAAKFYVSVFSARGKHSKVGNVTRYGKEGHEVHGMNEGTVMLVDFELDGQPFTALNGGPMFKFNEAISLQVFCDAQEDIDYFWTTLSEGGDPKAQQCGWLKDKYGVSWQIVPTVLEKLLDDPNRVIPDRVMKAVLQMKKLDIEELRKAYAQK